MGDDTDYHAEQARLDNSGGAPLDRRRAVVPPWPSRDTERHWHTYGIAGTVVIVSVIGFFLIDTLQIVRDDIKEVKTVVKQTEVRLIAVEKKLVAVATKEAALRTEFDKHEVNSARKMRDNQMRNK
jgi:hypothetical protein